MVKVKFGAEDDPDTSDTESINSIGELKMINTQNLAIIATLESKIDTLETALADQTLRSDAQVTEQYEVVISEAVIMQQAQALHVQNSANTDDQMTTLLEENKVLKEKLSQADEEVHSELNDLRCQLDVAQNQEKSLMETVESYKKDIESAKTNQFELSKSHEEAFQKKAEIDENTRQELLEKLSQAEEKEVTMREQIVNLETSVKGLSDVQTKLETLQCQLSASQEQENALKDTLESDKEIIESYKKDVETARTTQIELSKTHEEALAQIQSKAETDEQAHRDLTEKVSTAVQSELALREQITSLEAIVVQLEQNKAGTELIEENHRLHDTLMDVEKELNRFRTEAKRRKSESGSDQMTEVVRENEELTKTLAGRTAKLDDAKNRFRDKLEEIVTLSKENSKLTDQCELLLVNSVAKDGKIRELSDALVKLDTGVTEDLQQAVETKTELIHKLQEGLEKSQETNDDLFQQLQNRDTKMLELSDSIREGLTILKSKEQENTTLMSRLKELDDEIEELRIELDQKTLALDLANANVARVQVAHPHTEEQENGDFDEAEEDMEKLRQELEQKSDTIKELMEQLDVKTLDYHKLESQIEDLNGRLLDLRHGRESEIKQQMESLVDQIEIVKGQAEASDKRSKELEEENLQLKDEAIQLMQETEQAHNSQQNVDQIQTQLNDLTELVRQKETQMEHVIVAKDDEITKLSQTVTIQQEEILEISELRETIEKLTVENDDLRQEAPEKYYTGSRGATPPDSLADALAALNDENHFFREDISKKDNEIEELKDQVENLIKTGSTEQNIFRNEMKSITDENLHLREFNEKYVARICDLEDRVVTEENEVFVSQKVVQKSETMEVKTTSVNKDEKLQIQLEMINQMNSEIDSLRGIEIYIIFY